MGWEAARVEEEDDLIRRAGSYDADGSVGKRRFLLWEADIASISRNNPHTMSA